MMPTREEAIQTLLAEFWPPMDLREWSRDNRRDLVGATLRRMRRAQAFFDVYGETQAEQITRCWLRVHPDAVEKPPGDVPF